MLKPTSGNWIALSERSLDWGVYVDVEGPEHQSKCLATVSYVNESQDEQEMNARIMATSKNLTILAWKLARSNSTDAKAVEDLVIEAREMIRSLGL